MGSRAFHWFTESSITDGRRGNRQARYGSCSRELAGCISFPQGNGVNKNWGQATKSPSLPTPSDVLPPARLRLLELTSASYGAAIRGPSVQTHEPVGDILHSDHKGI